MKILPQASPERSKQKAFITFAMLLLLFVGSSNAIAQVDREQILMLRRASNEALKEFDYARFISYLTDDVHITTGNGAGVAGKDNLRTYLAEAVGDRLYFVRISIDVQVNAERGLAWELGTWKGHDVRQGERAITGGRYAAQWSKVNGEWRIRSELFVTLE